MTLRDALERAGLTQVDLAARLGVSKQRINHYVTGRHAPTRGMAARIEETLGFPLHLPEARLGRPRKDTAPTAD